MGVGPVKGRAFRLGGVRGEHDSKQRVGFTKPTLAARKAKRRKGGK